MSNFQNINSMGTDNMTGTPEQVFVFARPGALSGLEQLADTVTLVEIGPARDLPAELVSRARIAVIEVDPADSRSLARLDTLRAARPNLAIIAGLPEVDLKITRLMLRKGIGDVVAMPFTSDELLTAILEVDRELVGTAEDVAVELAPTFAVQKCSGGAGATTLATHLADAMARDFGEGCRACLIDLDLQSGDASSYLDQPSRKSLVDLLEAGNRLDDELFRAVATEFNDRVDVIAAPTDIMPIEEVELASLKSVIALAQRKYDLVIFDMPSSLTNWAMSVMLAADAVLLVSQNSIGALRQVKRRLQLLRSFDYHPRKVAIALNRVQGGMFKKVDRSGIEDALHHPIAGLVHSETQLIQEAQAQGVLSTTLERRSRFASDIEALADHLLALAEEG
ncbi:AAA family ATPase [Qipengyuania sp. 1NDH17]|uniref:AAA family ATPase n=1 Tax=Qipengyuania polymorpha TaxID=2867234 RepID=A0ABS7IZX0_9SPHN|nr:AAA family ATPase [Qipengyuania polymorpha]MBX7458998.1 AAA family ATPase [Qipengyuania polymorpha]